MFPALQFPTDLPGLGRPHGYNVIPPAAVIGGAIPHGPGRADADKAHLGVRRPVHDVDGLMAVPAVRLDRIEERDIRAAGRDIRLSLRRKKTYRITAKT